MQKVMWPGPVTNGLACSVGCAEDKQHCSWPRQKLLPSSESTLSPPFQSGVVVPCRASSWAPLTPPRRVWDRVASRRMLNRLAAARAALAGVAEPQKSLIDDAPIERGAKLEY